MPQRSAHLALAFALLVAASVPASAQQEQSIPVNARANVVLSPGDRVRLKVWREPDLSGDFQVDEDGVVVFPKVGRLDVKQISTDSLKVLLISRFAESLRSPSVEVTVLRRVQVLGSVKNPGLYYVDPTNTVADALALAGGISPDGKQDHFELIRGGKRLPIKLSQDSRLADSPMQPGDQLWVPERSWLSRNATVVAAGLTAAALIFAASIR